MLLGFAAVATALFTVFFAFRAVVFPAYFIDAYFLDGFALPTYIGIFTVV